MVIVWTLRRRVGLLLSGMAAVAVGLSAEDVTIPRVPNPPLAADLANLPGDLRAVAVPRPANLADFVKDEATARALGKALFRGSTRRHQGLRRRQPRGKQGSDPGP